MKGRRNRLTFLKYMLSNTISALRRSYWAYLAAEKIEMAGNTIGEDVYIHTEVKLMGDVNIGRGSILYGSVTVGQYSTIGAYCTLHGQVTIGRYCQLGPHVAVYAQNHAIEYLTTYNSKKLFDGRLKELGDQTPVSIGNDVWIGHGAIVLPGVSIGSGAIVGAGTVVTKSVDPYSIVVGNPARKIRTRMDTEIIQTLLNSEWWTMDSDTLLPLEALFRKKLISMSPGELSMLRNLSEESDFGND